jgi:hypothetical protein
MKDGKNSKESKLVEGARNRRHSKIDYPCGHSQPDRENYKIEGRLTNLIVKEGKAEDAVDFLLIEFDSITDIISNCGLRDIS